MPFGKSKRKGSRIIRTTLRNGSTKSVFKSFQAASSSLSTTSSATANNDNNSTTDNANTANASHTNSHEINTLPSQQQQFNCEEDNVCQFLLNGDVVKRKSSCYEKNKEKELCSWNSVKSADICGNYATKYKMLLEQKCIKCNTFLNEVIWCKTCGPFSTYCQDCADLHHKNMVFHDAIILKPHFEMLVYSFTNKLQDAHCCICPSKYSRVITVVSENGHLYQCEVWFCMCESEFMKLIKFDLWPSTPTKPSTAISMQLLDQFISLQMEGKISFTSFIDGMSWKSGIYNQTLKRTLTRFMQTDSIDQYRQFQRQLRDLWFSDLAGKNFDQCPACPKDNGSVFYCMDANFGLVLKSSASKSTNAPNNETGFLLKMITLTHLCPLMMTNV